MLFGKHVNQYYFKYSLFFLVGIAALVFVDYFQLLIPDVIGNVVDGLEDKSLTRDGLLENVKMLLIITAVMFCGRFLWRICIFGNGIRIENDLRNKMFYSMQKLSQKFFSENKTGSLMALYTNDLNAIRRTFGMGTIMLVDALCLGVMALYKMFALNAILSIVSLASLIVITVLGSIVGKKITKLTENNFKVYGRLSEYVQEDLSGIGVIKAFVKEKLQIQRFQKYNQENMDSAIAMTKISVKMNVFISFMLSVITIFIIGYGAYLVYRKSNGLEIAFSVGDLTRFIAYYGSLIWPIEAVGRLIELRSQGKASMKRISKIVDYEVEINDDLVPQDFAMTELKGKISYNHLSFSYPGSELEVLKNVSFLIKSGEFVGILGETGVGKTTITDLLLRIYNINEGMLLLDDVDIMHLPLSFVRNQIAYVPQDNFLFSDTIENNIAFSENDENDLEKITESAKDSDIYKDVIDFPNEFKTILGERGVTVSGGQKQRISIARALYKNSPILILDDSLSAVDTETEKTIISNLRKIRKGKTTIIIAHRITTLQSLDRIIVVEDGTVTGFGSHDELLISNSAYAKEVRLQELEKEVGVDDE